MSLMRSTDEWRSSSSRLLGMYCILFVTCSTALLGVAYWRVAQYIDYMAQAGLADYAQLVERFEGAALDKALRDSIRYDKYESYVYGLFSPTGQPIRGPLTAIPHNLPIDGIPRTISGLALVEGKLQHSFGAVGVKTHKDRILVIARQRGQLVTVKCIILDAIYWGIWLTIVPGLAGWFFLRRRHMKRIHEIEAATHRIVAGDLGQRLPVSARTDEIDQLSSIVNGMLERIEQLMGEVKGVCDSIAHDLRTPLTRLRTHLYRARTSLHEGDIHGIQIDKALAQTDTLMTRFTALLRVAELGNQQRRSAFVEINVTELLHELHAFYLPLAEENQQRLELHIAPQVAMLRGDRELMFEALANLLSNALRFTPEQGRILLRAVDDNGSLRIDVIDDGPGIAPQDRSLVYQRFFRGNNHRGRDEGFGLGLPIVAAIAGLHGFRIRTGNAPSGGAWLSICCVTEGLL
ncbi:ATP-binding protein [Stenotrophomonas sp. Iso1]|uniref:sensor histidine kinase n=1 Tax=Stenotrophomonas sp. Iso1 TaxID=2977283 RepID=UPI0022B77A97|nr:ATP-binding protein [Stenotrophomonas sp. Iso1]